MKKIVFLDAKTLGNDLDMDQFSKIGKVILFQTTSKANTITRIADAEIIVTNKVIIDANVMDHCPKLKLICISATGMNNVDLDAARAKGIMVKNAVGYSSHSVAQHTFASIFHLYNQLGYYDTYVKNGSYDKSDIFTHYGPPIIELNKKEFGIIGLGNIGKTVANIATAFGAKVSYFSTSGKNDNNVYPQRTLEEILKNSDIISIHAPLNEKTANLISVKQLSMMKSNAILINVGRGGIVDEKALAEAIDNNKIGGACVDVFPQEPIMADNPLMHVNRSEKLVLTPHNAWASVEARTTLIDIVYQHIIDFIG